MPSLKEDLQSPLAYPSPQPQKIDFIETHISWLFLTECDVYKIKKPVQLGFLDYSTPELRKHYCEAEVILNSQLTTDVYLGVVPILKSQEGFHTLYGRGETVDWAVHMIRLPDNQRADQILAHHQLGLEEIEFLAKHLAEFHSSSPSGPEIDTFGKPELIEFNVQENFQQTQDLIQKCISCEEANEIKTWQLSFLNTHRDLFESRITHHRIRDGHGDLRLEQIYLQPDHKITILDRIEFNERFRYADVCADLAFLSMDLDFHDHVDLGEYLLGCYAAESQDYELFTLVDFYQSYRAYIRGKVALFYSQISNLSENLQTYALQEARRYFLLSLSACRPFVSTPTLFVVGGNIASGKSTVSHWLSKQLAVPIIESDRTRKFLMGVSATQSLADRPWQGAYDSEITERVYTEMFQRAGIVLKSGRSVILDATFRSKKQRDRAKLLAQALQVPFQLIECQASPSACRERLYAREKKTTVSDARIELFKEFYSRYEPIDELTSEEHIVLDTSLSFEQTTKLLKQRLLTFLNSI